MTDIHQLSGAYALDAVDDDERALFEQHLTECEDCRVEVGGLRETAGLLALMAEAAPPPALRDSVLTGIAQVRPLPPPTSHRPDARRVAAIEGAPSRRRTSTWWTSLLVAAALALVAGVGLSVWRPWAPDEPALSAAERVLQAADAEKVAVDLGEAGRATVVRSRSEDRAVIVTEDMVPAPDGMVYELWFQTPEDDMVPAGLMPPAPDQTMMLDGPAAEATAVGITVEPEGGSPEPTSDPIALFDLSDDA
jgi:anti-sigma-K factor RskA